MGKFVGPSVGVTDGDTDGKSDGCVVVGKDVRVGAALGASEALGLLDTVGNTEGDNEGLRDGAPETVGLFTTVPCAPPKAADLLSLLRRSRVTTTVVGTTTAQIPHKRIPRHRAKPQ